MNDIPQAVQDAFFDALNDVSLTNLSPVVQHVLENTQPPLVVIGDINTSPFGGKDGGLDKVEVDVLSYFRGPNRKGLNEIQAAVRGRLDDQTIAATGYELSRPVLVSSDTELLEDGETYVGTQHFELFAQPA
jgi:hypothetical protein